MVAELARAGRVHFFPHTTPLVQGVLVRRGRLVPVFDVAHLLSGTRSSAAGVYLIARRSVDGTYEYAAIPVTGDCELVSATEQPRSGKLPGYIRGLLSVHSQGAPDDASVGVVDLEALLRSGFAEERA
jgi:chemotaxis signal transduction protein